MMNYKFMIAVLLISGQTLSFGQNGQVRHLSLPEALKLAQEQNYQVLIARSEVEQARGQNLESWQGFLPSVTISENYVKSNDPVTVFGLKLKQGVFAQSDFDLTALNDPNAFDNFTTVFQVQQPLINLDAVYGKSAARAGVKAREQALQRAKEAAALQVKKAYYGLILSRKHLKAVEQAVTSARAHRDDARAAFEQGMINQADYLAAQVRLAELQEQRINAEHQIANASDGLKFVLGISDDAEIVPTDSLNQPTTIQFGEETPARLSQRSDLRALRLQSQAASRQLWMQRSNWLPRLNAFAALEWNAADAFKNRASNWAVGLQLQWKLFEGLGKLGRSKQAAAKTQTVQVQLRRGEERARLEVRRAQRALKSAAERVQVAQSAVNMAQESLRIAEERFQQGLEKTSGLLDKEVALTNARLRFLTAQRDYSVAVSELQFAMGEE
ncbi:MAG: TolC family protein [bacterium]